ncbi:alpha-xenorhabdolysin family binary toxin subunit B [Pseudomonas sp. DWP3-1-2]|uniref:alpha-xenorhabdolysin family binary toxin subunit B n=1 Tax=Pseudomonas sp. DWP3-1-2 TaxID=2804645 RepID=UPI003CEECA88
MNIHPITTSFTPIAPDTASLTSGKVNLDKLYSKLDKLYLQPLQEQVNTLKQQQRRVDNGLRDLLVTVPVELSLDDIKRLMAEVSSNPDGRDLYIAEITEIVADSLDCLANKVTEFGIQLDLLKNSALSDVSGYIETNEQQRQIQHTACQALEAAVAAMNADKEAMNKAMRVTEDKTLWDEWLPLVRGIARLDPKNPTRSLMQAAVTGVTNILRIASESVTYSNLVEARKVLQSRIDDHYQRIAHSKTQIETLARQQSQLDNFQALAPHKTGYQVEVEKVSTTLTSFQSIHNQMAQGDPLERARSYTVQGEALSRYLQDILNKSR